MALDFAAGCLGGCAGIMVGYPLDTVKVHMQTQDYRNPKYRGTLDCLRTIVARESVSGLYRGMTSPMAGVALVNAIVFGVYGQAQKHLPQPNLLSSHFLAGVAAGVAQTPVSSVIELAKTRLQLQSASSRRFDGPLHCLRSIYKREGYRGVFNGLGITYMREAPSYGVYFLTYEALTRSTEPISTFRMLMAGGLAGTASWVISYPIDVIKSRMQAANRDRYTGAIDCLKQSVRAEGYQCLYRGLNSTILRAFPTNAATFAVVTWTFRLFGETNHQSTTQTSTEPISSAVNYQNSTTHETFVPSWNEFLSSVRERSYVTTRNCYLNLRDMALRDLVLEASALSLLGNVGTSVNAEEAVVEDSEMDKMVVDIVCKKKCRGREEAREEQRKSKVVSMENAIGDCKCDLCDTSLEMI